MNSLLVSMANTSSVPLRVSTTGTPLEVVTIWGYKSFTASGTPVNNAATIYVGAESGKLGIAVTPGSSYQFNFLERENLVNLWVNGNSGDGAYFLSY
jgi:hypothetical protein